MMSTEIRCALRSSLLSSRGIVHGFSLRTGGVSPAPFDSLNLGRVVGDELSHVETNHRRLAVDVGYDAERLYEVSQVHGNGFRTVTGAEDPREERRHEADALIAERPGVAVGVRVADCTPLLVADVRGGLVAAIHAGWRGVVANIAGTVLSEMQRKGARPADLVVALGPHIRRCCFEIGDDVADAIGDASGSARPKVIGRNATGRTTASLVDFLKEQLTRAGVAESNLDDIGGCTRCEPGRFFSYRRDGKRSGRHLAVIVAPR